MAKPVAHEPRYFARRGPFGYGSHDVLDRGQVIILERLANDEKLVRLGYLEPLSENVETYTCAECGAEFIGEPERRGHGDRRHRVDPYDRFDPNATAAPMTGGRDRGQRLANAQAMRGDVLAEQAAETALLNDVAPIYWDKTAASQKG